MLPYLSRTQICHILLANLLFYTLQYLGSAVGILGKTNCKKETKYDMIHRDTSRGIPVNYVLKTKRLADGKVVRNDKEGGF